VDPSIWKDKWVPDPKKTEYFGSGCYYTENGSKIKTDYAKGGGRVYVKAKNIQFQDSTSKVEANGFISTTVVNEDLIDDINIICARSLDSKEISGLNDDRNIVPSQSPDIKEKPVPMAGTGGTIFIVGNLLFPDLPKPDPKYYLIEAAGGANFRVKKNDNESKKEFRYNGGGRIYVYLLDKSLTSANLEDYSDFIDTSTRSFNYKGAVATNNFNDKIKLYEN
jgi:hypothetical protein